MSELTYWYSSSDDSKILLNKDGSIYAAKTVHPSNNLTLPLSTVHLETLSHKTDGVT
jgi:hypothetical protein